MKFTMKKLAFWLAVTMVLSFIVAGSIASSPEFRQTAFHFDWNEKEHGNSKGTLEQRTSTDGTGVEVIDTSFISEDISIVVSNSKEIQAHLSGNTTDDTKFTLMEEKNGDTVKIYVKRIPELNLSTDSLRNANVEISIPSSFSGELRVKTVSGSIVVQEMSLRKLMMDTISGDMTSKTKTGEMVINTVSGAAELKNLTGMLKANTTSGDIHGSYSIWKNSSVTANAISGALELELPKDADFHSDLKTVSGNTENDFIDNPTSGNLIKFNSVSGDLVLKKAP